MRRATKKLIGFLIFCSAVQVTITNGSQNITCTDCAFTQADVGKLELGTSAANTGFNIFLGSQIILPLGTITTVTDSTHVVVSIAATGTSCVGTGQGCLFAYGHDDHTAIASAWAATTAACGTLQLPAGKMFTSHAEFGNSAAGTCASGVGGARVGPRVVGWGSNVSQIIPIPNAGFAASCIAQNNICFGDILDGFLLADWEIFGLGVSNPGLVDGTFTNVSIVGVLAANNAQVTNFKCIGWGANNGANGIPVGVQLQGGAIVTTQLEEDGCGQTGIKVTSSGALEVVQMVNSTGFDNPFSNLYVNSGVATGATIRTINSNWGNGGGSGFCDVAMVNASGTNVYYTSIGDNIGLNSGTDASNGFCVGFWQGLSPVTGNGFAYILNGFNGASRQTDVFVNGTGDTAVVSNEKFVGTASTGIFFVGASGTLIDNGGNTFPATTKFSGTGSIFGSASITGTTCAIGNIVLTSGWGTSTVGTVTGDSHACQFTVSVTGVPAASPVITYTFPLSFYVAPRCTITENSGTFGIVTNPSHVITATTDTITFSGTPVATNSYTFIENCQ